jgi:hypothetical protein
VPQPLIRPPAPEGEAQTRWCIAGDELIDVQRQYWRQWMGAVLGDLETLSSRIEASYVRDMAAGCD